MVAKLNSMITRPLSTTTRYTLGKKDFIVSSGAVENAVIGTDGKPKLRYKLVVNEKPSKYLLRSWQGIHQVHQIIVSGDADKIFTKAGELKANMPDLIGTDKIRELFPYVCPIGLYNKPEIKEKVNKAVKSSTSLKKDTVWEQFLTFPKETKDQ